MSIRSFMRALRDGYRISRLRRAGCRVSPDVRLIGTSDFGEAPYLLAIGRHVTITSNCAFATHIPVEGTIERLTGRAPLTYGPITIHDNCFIGISSMIGPGVTIGPNSVVGAYSVVTEDVTPNTVVAGNPARVICTIEEYAERRLAQTPDYDVEAYHRDMRAVIEPIYLPRETAGAQHVIETVQH